MEADDEDASNFCEFSSLLCQVNHAWMNNYRDESKDKCDDAQEMVVRFDVVTPESAEDLRHHGCTCEVDLTHMIQSVWKQKNYVASDAKIPTQTFYIEKVYLENYKNEFDCDLKLNCKQTERIRGNNFISSSVNRGNDGTPSLYTLHSHQSVHYKSMDVCVFERNNFMDSNHYHSYRTLLDEGNDFNMYTTRVRGGNQVEYISPTMQHNGEGELSQGDCIWDIIWKNRAGIKNNVHAIDAHTATGERTVSLRMNEEDWDNIITFLTQQVINPLKAIVFDTQHSHKLDFVLTPVSNQKPGQANRSALPDANATMKQAWAQSLDKNEDYKHQTSFPRASVTLCMVLKFIH